MTLQDAQEKIAQMEQKESDLYSFLNLLIYETENPEVYIPLFKSYLDDRRLDIQAKCLEAILFVLKKRDDRFKEIAIINLSQSTTHENFDLKSWSIAGLGSAYFGTKDKKCVTVLNYVLNDGNENEVIRTSCLWSILGIYFSYTSHNIFTKNDGKITLSFEEAKIKYQLELNEVQGFLSN